MPTYRTFQYLEEYIVSSLQYQVYSINLERAEPRSEEGVHTAMCDNIDTRRVLETLERRCEGHGRQGKTGGFDRDLENILNALKPFFFPCTEILKVYGCLTAHLLKYLQA